MLQQVEFEVWGAISRPPGTLRPLHKQSFAVVVQIDQGEAGAQPIVVLGQAAVAHPVEAELALQHPEDMFYFGSYFRLSRVLFLL